MPFQLTLYRAADDVGPMNTWQEDHRRLLGTKSDVRAALDRVLPGLTWTEEGLLWFAVGPFSGQDHAVEISLHGDAHEPLHDFRIYASPPPIRAIMTALDLNYCFAVDSCELYFPFEAGDHWPAVAR
jgi:hypothetical protein